MGHLPLQAKLQDNRRNPPPGWDTSVNSSHMGWAASWSSENKTLFYLVLKGSSSPGLGRSLVIFRPLRTEVHLPAEPFLWPWGLSQLFCRPYSIHTPHPASSLSSPHPSVFLYAAYLRSVSSNQFSRGWTKQLYQGRQFYKSNSLEWDGQVLGWSEQHCLIQKHSPEAAHCFNQRIGLCGLNQERKILVWSYSQAALQG